MAEELKPLINKRGQVKAKVSRFRSYIDGVERSNDISQLNSRLIRFKDCITEFDSIQSEIELIDEETNHNLERELFESSFFELLEKSDKLLSSNTHSEMSSNSSNPNSSELHHLNHIRLPTIQLPTFSGKYEDWLQFYELFQSVIENNGFLSPIQKFYYLKSSLQGPALNVLDSLEVSTSNYETAWALLKTRFDNKRVIVNNHVTSIFDIHKLERESGVELRIMLDTINKHLRALKSLEQPIEHWDTLLVHIVSKKLDYNSIKLWETLQVTTQLPKFSDLTQFLENRCNVLEAININKPSPSSKPSHFQHNDTKKQHQFKKSATSSLISSVQTPCLLCNNNSSHKIFQCPKFNSMPVTERHQNVKKLGLCINCLSKGHIVKDCSSSKCKVCGSKHNSLLHFDSSSQPVQTARKAPSTTTLAVGTYNQVLLSTAIVNVLDKHGTSHQCRLLLDSGSQSNFITSNMVNKLQLKATSSNTPIVGIGQCHSNVTKSVECTIFSRLNSYKATLNFLVLQDITHDLPSLPVDIRDWNLPNTIPLADPQLFIPGAIDMLVGAEIFFKILSVGQFRPHKTGPILQKTSLGWIASGKVQTKQDAPMHSLLATDTLLHNQLKNFWELEECSPTPRHAKIEDDLCEQHFANTTTRDPNGRYTVDLPFKENITQLGDSKATATSRFLQLERKLAKNPSLHQSYSDFIDEYERLGHMVITSDSDETDQSYYIPHLPVIREESTTTKLRVVFDASAKTTTGISLNDTLMVGPTIQQDIFSIMARFRCHTYVLTADIEKMYRQIWVNDLHTNLQKILWRRDSSEPIRTYRLKTVTYGTSSAPFLAVRTLHQLAKEEKNNFPLGSSVALQDFYVDDMMTGDDSLENVLAVQAQITALLESGGFNIRKWNSNSEELLQNLPQEDTIFSEIQDQTKPVKVLGMIWNSNSDCFQYSIQEQNPFKKISKRTVLSEIASLYDPLGLVGPVILKSKLFMQDLWKLNIQWDESLPTVLHSEWQVYRQQLCSLKELQVPRHVMCPENIYTEIHGFCDASERAYGACIYVRTLHKDGNITVNLLCSKSRVSPISKSTIPRLELCGALLLSKLYTKVVAANVKHNKCILWSDSTIVLAWINAPSSDWKVFVSNRVKEIQNLTRESCEWKHVRTSSNPADLISRGLSPCQVINCQLWWQGPQWLSIPEELWPTPEAAHDKVYTPDKRKVVTALTTIQAQPLVDPTKYSSLVKMERVTVIVLRFINNLRKPQFKTVGPILPCELDKAKTYLIKNDQIKYFNKDYAQIKDNKPLKPNSHLSTLQPFIDDEGLLRVGGRLRHAPVHNDQKHPILLPSDSHLTKLIVSHAHKTNLHAGPLLLLSIIRQQYWPLKGRNLVRQVVHKCIQCFKASPRTMQPQMGDLPLSRVDIKRPFTNTGTDLAGPIFIRSSRRRNSQITKGYIVIFVCFTTKAIHLELVSGLTTEAFLAALKRFISRRGICKNIYSDNGTNFVGASRELDELRKLFLSQEHQKKIIDVSAAHQITWHFIPPRSPHFGGLWEAGIKSVKYHMKRVIGNASLTYEALYTTLTMIEACLNSRPLTPLSNNPNDTLPLTPGHFLTGNALTAPPEPSLESLPINRLSMWQRTQQLTQHFWSRWSREYLSSLQQRPKWRGESPNLQPGQLVIVKDDNLPPLKWVTARVVDVHPGADNKVRVATIKTSSGTYRRAANKLCVLPVE